MNRWLIVLKSIYKEDTMSFSNPNLTPEQAKKLAESFKKYFGTPNAK